MSDEEIADLNARATRRGKQGEGHSVLAKDKTFLLSSQDERQIALRQFSAALESAEHGLAITASLLQESAPERVWNPSELFSQAYFVARNAPLSQETMSMLREKTSAWLKDKELFESAPAADEEIDQTRIAYEVRRKAEVPFGEYEFALREPIDREITLRATEWDKVVKTPALIWLKKYLGVENQEPDLNQWSAATGTWVHDWLAYVADRKKKTSLSIFQRVTRCANGLLTLRTDSEKRLSIFVRPAVGPFPIGGTQDGVMLSRWLIFSPASWRKWKAGRGWRRSGNWNRPSFFR